MVFVWQTHKCPHCWVVNRFESVKYSYNSWSVQDFYNKIKIANWYDYWRDWFSFEEAYFSSCTNCHKLIVILWDQIIYPLSSIRGNAPEEVPWTISSDYNEACLVEPYSKKASWALARRCLQSILIDQWIKWKDLNTQIDNVISTLPSQLADSIDSIRVIGNFSAHPIKSTNTWEIIDVEPEETEWILDVLESLFDYYYVQPKLLEEKKAKLNQKLAEAWKQPLK